MRRNAIARIVFFSVAIFVLSAILVVGLSLNLYSFRRSDRAEVQIAETEAVNFTDDSAHPVSERFNPESVRSMEIEWAAGSVEIVSSDVNEIQVCLSGNSEPVSISLSGSTLEIRYTKKGLSFGIHNDIPESDLYILVPRDWQCRKLDIDAAAVEILVNGLCIQNVDIDIASGDISFTNCDVDSLDLDSASGDLKFTGCLNKLNFDSASGAAVLVLSNNPRSIEMDTASGKLELTLPADCGFTVERSSLGGHFDCEFSLQKHGDQQVCGDGSCKISMDGLSADLVIRKGAENACEWGQHHSDTNHNEETAHHEEGHH